MIQNSRSSVNPATKDNAVSIVGFLGLSHEAWRQYHENF